MCVGASSSNYLLAVRGIVFLMMAFPGLSADDDGMGWESGARIDMLLFAALLRWRGRALFACVRVRDFFGAGASSFFFLFGTDNVV